MDMKVNFYKVELHNSGTHAEEDYGGIRAQMIDIIDRNGINARAGAYNMKVVDLSQGDSLHVIADIFSYEEDCLFMRLCSQQQTGAYVRRNYADKVPRPVLDAARSEDELGIEAYTYLYYKYDTGIAGIVNHKNAPKGKTMGVFYEKYMNEFYLSFLPILNRNGVDLMRNQGESSISKIEVELPIPDAGVLQEVFGWDVGDILDVQNGELKAVVELSAFGHRKLTRDAESTDRLIDILADSVENTAQRIKLRGKVNGNKTQDYCFYDDYFTYPVDIPVYRTVDKKKVYFQLDERIPYYRSNLEMAYNENKELILILAGRV